MKVICLDFVPLSYDGGFERNLIGLGVALSNQGHEVSFLSCSDDVANVVYRVLRGNILEVRVDEQTLNERLQHIPYKKIGWKNLLPFTREHKTLRDEFLKADVIYTKNEIFDILVTKLFISSKTSTKIICGAHTPFHYPTYKTISSRLHNLLYSSFFYKWLIRDVRMRFLTLSVEDGNKVIIDFGIDTANVRVIPNGVDTDKFSPLISEYDEQRIRPFSFLFVGRLTEPKGLDVLQKSIEILSSKEEFSDMHFLIAGSGELEAIPLELSKRFSNVEYLGHVENMVDLYHKSDCLVAPSRWEGMPYSCLEAQSCGLPVVGSSIAGIRAIVIDGQTGALIPSEDPVKLARALSEMMSVWKKDRQRFNKMKSLARMNIVSKYSIPIINKRIEEFFLESCK